jgi:hypothetical protein
MAAHSELRNALLAKLGVSGRRLHQLAAKRKAQLPMTTVQAYYTIAHDHGIDVSRYLSPEETAEIRGLVAQLKATPSTAASAPPRPRPASSPSRPRTTVVTIGGVKVENVPGLDPAHAKEAKAMAEVVYPMIYVFENSARDLIARVLERAYGSDWWELAVPKKIRDAADRTKKDEEKEAWHGARGRRDIDYVLLSDLAKIVRARWEHFEEIFPRESWFEELVSGDMNVPRRVIAHMHPVSKEDVRLLEAAFRKWANQLKAKADRIP